MIYQNVHIYLSTWFPIWGQGWTLNSKRVFVKIVKDPTKIKVSIDTTADVIQHEIQHTRQIRFWLFWIITILYQYVVYGYNKALLELEAIKAENKFNPEELRLLVIDFCKNNNLEYY
jgi:hypothetical protein